MKHELTLANIKSFVLEKKPVGVDSEGRIIFEPNLRGEPYYVFDSASGAPVGIAPKVAKRKTFVVQRKIEGRTFRDSLGSVAEFLQEKDGVEKARAAAAKIGTEIRTQQINPSVVARKQSAAELTLGQAFAAYREHLTTRETKRANEATLKVFDRCVKRFDDWNDRKIRMIDIDELVERCKARQKVAATANEQEFRQTYNRTTHAARKWVFPAINKPSKAGHYVDAKDLLEQIRDMAGIPALTRHDLRRSFGTVLEALEAPASISKRFMNHDQSETHNRYTQAEWERMKGWMERIEQAMLTKGPNVWNSLKPLEKSPLPAGDLPAVPADKPRTGRPRREYLVCFVVHCPRF